MRPRVCLGVKQILTNGENARDKAQWLPNALSLWELHSCGSYKCLETWLERQKNTKLGLHDIIRKVLKCRCLRCPFIVHLNLICMSYDQDKRWESNWEFDYQPQIPWKQESNEVQLECALDFWKDLFEGYKILPSHFQNFKNRVYWFNGHGLLYFFPSMKFKMHHKFVKPHWILSTKYMPFVITLKGTWK
jgi:hypothetical protein